MVIIQVNDANEPPAAPDAPTVAQNTTTPKTQLDVSWTAPGMTGKPPVTDYDVQYKKSSDSTWTSHTFTGTRTSTTITGLTGGTSYSVQVRATNDEGTSDWSDTSAAQTQHTNVNPRFALLNTDRSVTENAVAGTNVGLPVTATDTEGHALTYSLTGSTLFTVDSATGQISVAEGADINYESATEHTVTVSASDRMDNHGDPDHIIDVTSTVTITVNDTNEPAEAPGTPGKEGVHHHDHRDHVGSPGHDRQARHPEILGPVLGKGQRLPNRLDRAHQRGAAGNGPPPPSIQARR